MPGAKGVLEKYREYAEKNGIRNDHHCPRFAIQRYTGALDDAKRNSDYEVFGKPDTQAGIDALNALDAAVGPINTRLMFWSRFEEDDEHSIGAKAEGYATTINGDIPASLEWLDRALALV